MRSMLPSGPPPWTEPAGIWRSYPPSWCKCSPYTAWHRQLQHSRSAACFLHGQQALFVDCPETTSTKFKYSKNMWSVSDARFICYRSKLSASKNHTLKIRNWCLWFLTSRFKWRSSFHCVSNPKTQNLFFTCSVDSWKEPKKQSFSNKVVDFSTLKSADHSLFFTLSFLSK